MSSDFESHILTQLIQALTTMALNNDTRPVTLSKTAEIYGRKYPEATVSNLRSIIERNGDLLELNGDEIVLSSAVNDVVSKM